MDIDDTKPPVPIKRTGKRDRTQTQRYVPETSPPPASRTRKRKSKISKPKEIKRRKKFSKIISGEFYDISVPTRTNKFGEAYIQEIYKNGISISIEKYISELDEILKSPKDDKTNKRLERREFLKMCQSIDECKNLFTILTNLLNGAGSKNLEEDDYKEFPNLITELRKPDLKLYQYENQSIILTSAGGNIITIFCQLIYIIGFPESTFKNIGTINRLIFGIMLKVFYEEDREYTVENIEKLFNETKEKIKNKKNTDSKFEKSLLNLCDKNYSDFDFKITPNKNTTLEPLNPVPETDKDEGFLLLRGKTALNCYNDSIHENKFDSESKIRDCFSVMKTNTEGKAREKIIFAAQTMQLNYFTIGWLTSKYILKNPSPEDVKTKEIFDLIEPLLTKLQLILDSLPLDIIKLNEIREEINKIGNMKSHDSEDPPFRKFTKCLNFLIFLYIKKIEIGIQTKVNVDRILDLNKERYKVSEQNLAMGDTHLSDFNDFIEKYENIIQFLYGITKVLNNYLKIILNQTVVPEDIYENFLNLNNLLLLNPVDRSLTYNIKCGYIPFILSKLFLYLLTNPIFENKNIINLICRCNPMLGSNSFSCNSLTPSFSKIFTYYSQESIEVSLKEKEETSTLAVIYNYLKQAGIPNGMRAVINVIKTNKQELTQLTNSEIDEFVDAFIYKNSEGKDIDLSLLNGSEISDEELLLGVPDDAIEIMLKNFGYSPDICSYSVGEEQKDEEEGEEEGEEDEEDRYGLGEGIKKQKTKKKLKIKKRKVRKITRKKKKKSKKVKKKTKKKNKI